MPAFSLTAPQYTNEDEMREKASVTKEEETHIRNDLFGRPIEARAAIVPEDEADDLIQRLQDALKEIPEDQKEDAMKAMAEYPNLIETEAKLIYFLRTVDFDPEKAAIRFCKYWEYRVRIFKDRAYLPMKRGGALTEDDFDIILKQPECCTILSKDEHGRVVIYNELSGRDLQHYDRWVLVRAVWYVMHLLLPLQSAQDFGIVAVTNYNTYAQLNHFDRIQFKHLCASVIEALPIHINANHVCCRSFIGAMILKAIMTFLNRGLRLRTRVHKFEGVSLVKELEVYGMSQSMLPTKIGGYFRLDLNILEGDGEAPARVAD